ncbi:MAG: class I SAM-dependent methyltransferase [Rhizomicrobium sp.]|jgi:SAM-dependent methyltransferase
MSHKDVFNRIYSNDLWRHGSGAGSTEKNTVSYRWFIQNFIRSNNILSVVDIGCGDWQFSRLIDWGHTKYLGLDVSDVVLANTTKFSRPGIEFREMDALTDPLPTAELAIVKDVLQHWGNDDILNFIPKLSAFRMALITNSFHPAGLQDKNKDIPTGGWRTVDLAAEPFKLKGQYVYWIMAGEPKMIFLWTADRAG